MCFYSTADDGTVNLTKIKIFYFNISTYKTTSFFFFNRNKIKIKVINYFCITFAVIFSYFFFPCWITNLFVIKMYTQNNKKIKFCVVCSINRIISYLQDSIDKFSVILNHKYIRMYGCIWWKHNTINISTFGTKLKRFTPSTLTIIYCSF